MFSQRRFLAARLWSHKNLLIAFLVIAVFVFAALTQKARTANPRNVSAGSPNGLPVLFGTNQGGGGPSNLYSINPTTGAATLVGATGFNEVSAIAFDGSGTLYGVGHIGAGLPLLITINTTTGAGTQVGATGLVFNFTDMSFRHSDGKLYAYSKSASQSVWTINKGTGAATLVGPSGAVGDGNGLAFSTVPPDTLYKGDKLFLSTINQATGTATAPMPLIYPIPNSRVNGMDFDASGTLWASVNSAPNTIAPPDSQIAPAIAVVSNNYLATINTSTGVVTKIGDTVNGLDSLAVQPPAGPCSPDVTPPTITCPGSLTKFTDSGQFTATVNPGTPVASDNCALQSVTGVRSDGKALNAPYPIGVTLIAWTARDASGNTASCGQSITVMVPSGGQRKHIP
jgi:hypothetical protein